MDTLLDFWSCTWTGATLIVLWYFSVIVTNPKIPPRPLFRHILPVLRSDSRSIVAIKLTIQTPPTFSFHPLYPRSCQHRNNNNSNYFPFVKFHICLCLWMGSLLGLFRFLLHFLFGFTLCIRCFLSQSSLLFLCWRIFSPESLVFFGLLSSDLRCAMQSFPEVRKIWRDITQTFKYSSF